MVGKRRIILTNANVSVFKPSYCKTFLSDLIVHALFHEEVLIREGDLIGNTTLTKHLDDDTHFRVFAELLSVGAIKILRLGQKSYPKNVRRDPTRCPISARAEDQELNRSDRGRIWKAKRRERNLFSKLDQVLIGSSESMARQRPFPKENAFALELSEVLANRESYKLSKRSPFRDISSMMAEKFVEFCNDTDAWERFLHDSGVGEPLRSGRGFYRTQAYQCAEIFHGKQKRGMQRLIESAYAACECDREDAEGRYGQGALTELPARYVDCGDTSDEIRRSEVLPMAPKESFLPLIVTPGIGDVLAEVREKKTFRNLQSCLNTIDWQGRPEGEYVNPHARFVDAWGAVCADFADAWARYIPRQNRLDKATACIPVGLYVGARFLGFIAAKTPCEMLGTELAWLNLADLGVVPGIYYLGRTLSRKVRALAGVPKLREQIFNMVSLRSVRVERNARQSDGSNDGSGAG